MKIEEKSCGCIIFDENKNVLLVKEDTGEWGFPKGHVEHDESEEDTAKREVKEETNLDVEIDLNRRYTMYYTTDKGKYKEVVLFVAKKIGGNLKEQDGEIAEVRWVDMYDVTKILSYDSTKELFNDVLNDNK